MVGREDKRQSQGPLGESVVQLRRSLSLSLVCALSSVWLRRLRLCIQTPCLYLMDTPLFAGAVEKLYGEWYTPNRREKGNVGIASTTTLHLHPCRASATHRPSPALSLALWPIHPPKKLSSVIQALTGASTL